MWRVCDLFEAIPTDHCEALGFASTELIQTAMRASLSAPDRANALICKIIDAGDVSIHVAFERDAVRQPSHEMPRRRALEIIEAVRVGAKSIIGQGVNVRASRWLGAPGAMYLVSVAEPDSVHKMLAI